MTRSSLPLPEYFGRYISLVDDVSLTDALDISLNELKNIPKDRWKGLRDYVYAPGKWTINDIMQHIIDTERVFAYRALSFARGEKEVKSFDENGYATLAQALRRNFDDLQEEAICVRQSSIYLFNSFNQEMLDRVGMGFAGEYSVHAIGFMICGHQRWHFDIIEDRYF